MPRLLQVGSKRWILGLLAAFLVACGTTPLPEPPRTPQPSASTPVETAPPAHPVDLAAIDSAPLPPPRVFAKSRWLPVRWSELPGMQDDALFEAWNAWLRSCERPNTSLANWCPQIRQLSIASEQAQRQWLLTHWQPYRIVSATGTSTPSDGLLTGYFEPLLEASRSQRPGFTVPLYQTPTGHKPGRPWFSRKDMDTLPEAQAALRGREIMWIANPVDALVLQIQGSGRLKVQENDGSVRTVRLAFAGTNEQGYKSVGRWLIDQGQVRDASWPAIKAWIARNPQRVQEMLWSNPRVVFFKEEAIAAGDANVGPRGAQGVPLTPGRSIAVDPGSIPYGTPVWLASQGPTVNLQRLVFAQDTGSAIVGAVRADYFVGAGDQAGDIAGRLKQNLQLWALWPR